jgi:DHA2 family multidrug resistance protein
MEQIRATRKRNKDDWFGSPFIVRLAIIAAAFLVAFLVIELTAKKPLVNLRLLLNRNFGIGTVANVLVGFALFGSIYVLPQYLGQVQGYNADQIGLVLAWTGLPQLVLIPLVPWLMKRFDIRYIGSLGILIFAASCFMNTTMSIDYSGDQLWLPNIVRAIGQALVITPLTAVAMFGTAPKDAGDASGLFNMLRNLGGAVGTAALATIITKCEQFHSNIIGQSVTLSRDEVRQRIEALTNYFMAWRPRSGNRAASGHCRSGQIGQTRVPCPCFQRHLRGTWRGFCHRRHRPAFRPTQAGAAAAH